MWYYLLTTKDSLMGKVWGKTLFRWEMPLDRCFRDRHSMSKLTYELMIMNSVEHNFVFHVTNRHKLFFRYWFDQYVRNTIKEKREDLISVKCDTVGVIKSKVVNTVAWAIIIGSSIFELYRLSWCEKNGTHFLNETFLSESMISNTYIKTGFLHTALLQKKKGRYKSIFKVFLSSVCKKNQVEEKD